MGIKLRSLGLWLLVGLFLFPFAYLSLLSVAVDWQYPALLPARVSLESWEQILSAPGGLAAGFGLSLVTASLVSLSATLSGFVASRFVAYHRYRRWLLLSAYFPFLLSPVIYGTVLYIYFIWLNLAGTWAGVLLAQYIIAFPFSVILLSGFWNPERKAQEELVATLGGNRWQAFAKVLLPMAKGPLLVCFFQTFLISWFEYGLTSLIGLGQVQTLTVRVFAYIGEANIRFAALSSCLLILLPALLIGLNKRFAYRIEG